jgi:hypothetical protein
MTTPTLLYRYALLLLAVAFAVGVILLYTHKRDEPMRNVGMALSLFSAAIIFLGLAVKGMMKIKRE